LSQDLYVIGTVAGAATVTVVMCIVFIAIVDFVTRRRPR